MQSIFSVQPNMLQNSPEFVFSSLLLAKAHRLALLLLTITPEKQHFGTQQIYNAQGFS